MATLRLPLSPTHISTSLEEPDPTLTIDTANSFGPYIHGMQATNQPTMSFLITTHDPLLKHLNIPTYLLNHHRHHDHHSTTDSWLYYLSAALARHFSYRKACAMLPTATPHYHLLYRDLRISFAVAVEKVVKASQGQEPFSKKEQQTLLSLDRDLTHETFGCFPTLFTTSFRTNERLIKSFLLPCIHPTVLETHVHDPRTFYATVSARLDRDWIDLSDVEDILVPTSIHSRIYHLLEELKSGIMAFLRDCVRDMDAAVASEGDGDSVVRGGDERRNHFAREPNRRRSRVEGSPVYRYANHRDAGDIADSHGDGEHQRAADADGEALAQAQIDWLRQHARYYLGDMTNMNRPIFNPARLPPGIRIVEREVPRAEGVENIPPLDEVDEGEEDGGMLMD